jgi:hypothetical protein
VQVLGGIGIEVLGKDDGKGIGEPLAQAGSATWVTCRWHAHSVTSESTVGVRVAAVLSFYRYHADAHQVPVADRRYRPGGRAGRYVPGLAHLQLGGRRPGAAVRVRRLRRGRSRR